MRPACIMILSLLILHAVLYPLTVLTRMNVVILAAIAYPSIRSGFKQYPCTDVCLVPQPHS
jgi:hypothetical protein